MNQHIKNPYWEKRQSDLYYQVVRLAVDALGRNAKSIVDVGSSGCPYLDWFDHIPDRASIDLRQPYEAPGIRSFKGSFLTWQPDKHYEIVTCLQVLEHVPDAGEFAQKLLDTGSTIIISVPYKWKAGKTKGHVHDPVDEDKLKAWFGRAPDYKYICKELTNDVRRIVQIYCQSESPRLNTKELERSIQKLMKLSHTKSRKPLVHRILKSAKKWFRSSGQPSQ